MGEVPSAGVSGAYRAYSGASVLITGGLGFIGSNLAIALVGLGSSVTIVDNLLAEHGANKFNIEPVRGEVRVEQADVRDEARMSELVRGQDVIFHLAGQNDHVRSAVEPFLDIDINVRGTAVLLEACRLHNGEARVIYTGTRGEYGAVDHVPVSEDAPTRPKGVYELTSLTAQHLMRIYHENHGLRTVSTRLTNIYGERSQMRHPRFGVANWFIRLALEDRPIQIFGSGTIRRDFLYVADCIDALLGLGLCDGAIGGVFNVGNEEPSCFLDFARAVISEAGRGSIEMVPFTPERAAQEPGDYVSDTARIRSVSGWKPRTPLNEGIARTLAYYRSHREHYW